MRNFTYAMMLTAVLCGCATTKAFVRVAPDYQQVPREALAAVALRVEQTVAQGDRETRIVGQDGIVLDTPAIQQAIRTRAARAELLGELLDAGFLYEKRSGLVYIQRNEAYKARTTRAERDRHAMVVTGENGNRWAIYEGIVKASSFPPATLSAVQETFFNARQALMKPGQRYEGESGEIQVK